MGKNTNNNKRLGWIRNRIQYYDPIKEAWLKRDTQTGLILDEKKGEPWKGIRKEKTEAIRHAFLNTLSDFNSNKTVA